MPSKYIQPFCCAELCCSVYYAIPYYTIRKEFLSLSPPLICPILYYIIWYYIMLYYVPHHTILLYTVNPPYLWVPHLHTPVTMDRKYLGGWGKSRKFQKVKVEFATCRSRRQIQAHEGMCGSTLLKAPRAQHVISCQYYLNNTVETPYSLIR